MSPDCTTPVVLEPAEPSMRHDHRSAGIVVGTLATIFIVTLFALVMTLFSHTASAAVLGVQTVSWHDRNQPNGEPYRADTPGLYLRTDSGWTVGAYSNSIGRLSVHAGYAASLALTERISAGLYVGAVTGYQHRTTHIEWCSTQPGSSDVQPCRQGLYLNWVTTESGGSKTYLAPLIAPSVAVKVSDSVALRLNVLPMPRDKGATAVNVAIEVTLP